MSISFGFNLFIELEHEEDGRWIADIVDLPGVVAYGNTRHEAIINIKALVYACLLNVAICTIMSLIQK